MALFTSENEYIGHKLNSDFGGITVSRSQGYKTRYIKQILFSLKGGLKF